MVFGPIQKIPVIASKCSLIAMIFAYGLLQVAFGQDNANTSGKLTKCWEFRSEAGPLSVVGTDADQIYLKASGGTLVGLNDSGVQVWSNDLGGNISSNSVSIGDRLFVASNTNATGVEKIGKLDVVSRRSGLTLKTTLIEPADHYALFVDEATVIVVGKGGSIAAFDHELGQLWKFSISGDVQFASHISNGVLTLAGDDRSVRQISARTGETILKIDGGSVPSAISHDGNGAIFLGDKKGRIYRLDSSNGQQRWELKTGGQIQAISTTGSKLIAVSVDNFVYSISAGRGSVLWKTRLPGRMAGRFADLGETVFVPVLGSGEVFVMEMENGRITDRVRLGPENSGEPLVATMNESLLIATIDDQAFGYGLGVCKN